MVILLRKHSFTPFKEVVAIKGLSICANFVHPISLESEVGHTLLQKKLSTLSPCQNWQREDRAVHDIFRQDKWIAFHAGVRLESCVTYHLFLSSEMFKTRRGENANVKISLTFGKSVLKFSKTSLLKTEVSSLRKVAIEIFKIHMLPLRHLDMLHLNAYWTLLQEDAQYRCENK